MDFHAAMETFAEAWVAANTQTAVNSDPQSLKPSALEDLPTLLPKEQLIDPRLSSGSSCKAERPSSNPNPHQPPSINGGKPLPIHCIIEQTTGAPTFDGSGAGHTTVELDSYAILPGSTPLNELVRTALIKLGYTATKIMGAKGVIQLKNWSPLEFGMITDNLQATVEEILGDLTSVATLRIRLCSWISGNDIEWTDQSVRTAVISLLKDHSQSLLAKLSPLSQSMISNIANWKYINKLSAEKCREFGEWYNRYKSVANGNYSNGCPRDSRLTFHPQHELPLMRDWYRTCRSPSHEKFVQFAEELNKGQVRQERPKVTTAKLKIWWKNEKQRERKHQKLQSCSGMKMDPTLASNSNICQDMTLSRCPDMSMDGSTNLVELL